MMYKFLITEQEYEATQSEETLRTIINADFRRPYLPRANLERRESELLERRAEDVPKRSVPDGMLFMAATVDVQGDKSRRFVVQVTGYGAQGERWVVDRYSIRRPLRTNEHGKCYSIDPASHPEDWDLLLPDVFEKSWTLASDPSERMRLMAMAVNSGREDDVTDSAYKFWRKYRREGLDKKICLFKGNSVHRSKLITRTFPDNIDRSTRHARIASDIPLHPLQADALKDQVNNALWHDSPGPNYVHFPDWLGSWFYDKLTYGERSTDDRWGKPGCGADEAFNLLVYTDMLAILHDYEKIKWPATPEWARRETWLGNAPPEAGEAASQAPEPTKKRKRKKPATDDSNPWNASGG